MTSHKHKDRDIKLEKRRNIREQNSVHQEKGKSKKIKKRYNKNDESIDEAFEQDTV